MNDGTLDGTNGQPWDEAARDQRESHANPNYFKQPTPHAVSAPPQSATTMNTLARHDWHHVRPHTDFTEWEPAQARIDALERANNRLALLIQCADEIFINRIIRAVAELPDRNSPEGQPEMMLVTGDELRQIINEAVKIQNG